MGMLFARFTEIMEASILHIQTVWIDIALFSFLLSAVFSLIFYFVQRSGRKRLAFGLYDVGLIFGLACSIRFCDISKNLPDYVPRLNSILDNADYIFHYTENQSVLLNALGIEDDSQASGKVKEILFYMNKREWETVIESGSSMAWYLEKLYSGIHRTAYIVNFHLSLPLYRYGMIGLGLTILGGGIAYLLAGELNLASKKKNTVIRFVAALGTVLLSATVGGFLFWIIYLAVFRALPGAFRSVLH